MDERAAAFQERAGVRKLRRMLREAGVEVAPTPQEAAARRRNDPKEKKRAWFRQQAEVARRMRADWRSGRL